VCFICGTLPTGTLTVCIPNLFPPKQKHNVGLLRFDDDHAHISYRFAQVPIFGGKSNVFKSLQVLFTKFCKRHPKSAIERFNLLGENGVRGFSNLEILQHDQIALLKNYFLNRARDNTFFNGLVSADKSYTPLNLIK
jgi:hypothetical protein